MTCACTDARLGELVGAWVLGACPKEEADAVREHLRTCPTCAEEAAHLRPVREALLGGTPSTPAPPAMRAAVMHEVRREAELFAAATRAPAPTAPAPRARPLRDRPRRWRPVPALALASTVVVLGAAGVVATLPGDPDRVAVAQVDPGVAPDGRARVEVREGRARVQVSGLPAAGPGRAYQVWVQSGATAPEPTAALFSVDAAGAGEVEVPGDVEGVDRVLVTSEPASGSLRPTRSPVLRADI